MSVSKIISQKLNDAFSPIHLDVFNESHNHRVPRGSESHFKVVIVSDFFKEKKLIQRHRAVNAALAKELKNSIHALAIHTYSIEEWQKNQQVPDSPKCKG